MACDREHPTMDDDASTRPQMRTSEEADKDPSEIHREEQRRILAAKRRIIEREVMDLLAVNKNDQQKQETSSKEEQRVQEDDNKEEDDGYEEICFKSDSVSGGSTVTAKSRENHYLTPLVSTTKLVKKSNSDSDLLMMDENREIELLCRKKKTEASTEKTFTYDEPEQGFYRVYDDLDRVREWDLIPYVITRKMKEAEALLERENLLIKADEEEVKEKKKGDGCSRVSLDSGRASVVSSLSNVVQRPKRMHSDSGSNCSADSGTYNLYDGEHRPRAASSSTSGSNFVKQVYQQLDSIRSAEVPKATAASLCASSLSLTHSSRSSVRQPRSKRRILHASKTVLEHAILLTGLQRWQRPIMRASTRRRRRRRSPRRRASVSPWPAVARSPVLRSRRRPRPLSTTAP